MNEKPEALRLADILQAQADRDYAFIDDFRYSAAAELRRLHAENEVLTAKVKAREDEILTHSEAVYEATKLLSEEREKNERLREENRLWHSRAVALFWKCDTDNITVGRLQSAAKEIDAALRREET